MVTGVVGHRFEGAGKSRKVWVRVKWEGWQGSTEEPIYPNPNESLLLTAAFQRYVRNNEVLRKYL